jgi:uncharacterized protein (TIGR02145 family)
MMKKLFFLFAALASVAASAQGGITVTPAGTDYANKTITFNVSWLNKSRTGTHNAKVWVFIDYRATAPGAWTRALVAGTPTATSGTLSMETGNNKGFWLQGTSGSAGSYSAKVTVKLANVPAVFSWCAYISDCPPTVTANDGKYTFKGTPPFTLIAANGAPTQTVPGKTLPIAAMTVTPAGMKDATECPAGFCPYMKSDLYMDATHKCQQRAAGAKNWEAWIKDARDGELYRIVVMPDKMWWLAQNLKYAQKGKVLAGCGKDSCGRFYTGSEVFAGKFTANIPSLCPPGWVLPTNDQWSKMALSFAKTYPEAYPDLRSLNGKCSPRPNRFGWAALGKSILLSEPRDGDGYWSTDGKAPFAIQIDQNGGHGTVCGGSYFDFLGTWGGHTNEFMPVRCIRLP